MPFLSNTFFVRESLSRRWHCSSSHRLFYSYKNKRKKKLCYFALPNLKEEVDRFMLLLGPFK